MPDDGYGGSLVCALEKRVGKLESLVATLETEVTMLLERLSNPQKFRTRPISTHKWRG